MGKPNQASGAFQFEGDPFTIGEQMAEQFCPVIEKIKPDFEPHDLFMLAAGFITQTAETAGAAKASATHGCANCETVAFLLNFRDALKTFIDELTTAEHGEAEAEPGRAH
ncbi:hypothetical protein [Asticcacaulis taihuensis]|uniref:hypothetical protein n=1 Tax=Asticcacaulis taihuensis TaxID=260084 RepID=UPI0026EE45B0|nr:hypothetical protein [Asticcacaulis taihuensis]